MLSDMSVMYSPFVQYSIELKKDSTRMGFEPTRAEHNGLAVHRLNHSATLSPWVGCFYSCPHNAVYHACMQRGGGGGVALGSFFLASFCYKHVFFPALLSHV